MASNFAAYIAQGAEKTVVREYKPGTAFIVGSFVVYDTSGNDMDICGTNPVLIAGLSEVSSVAHTLLTPDGKVPVRIITASEVLIALASTTTPADSHIGDQIGLTLVNGIWLCDVSKATTTSRATVVDVDIAAGIFFVTLHANALQFAMKTVPQS